jgi:hypothetical protein
MFFLGVLNFYVYFKTAFDRAVPVIIYSSDEYKNNLLEIIGVSGSCCPDSFGNLE